MALRLKQGPAVSFGSSSNLASTTTLVAVPKQPTVQDAFKLIADRVQAAMMGALEDVNLDAAHGLQAIFREDPSLREEFGHQPARHAQDILGEIQRRRAMSQRVVKRPPVVAAARTRARAPRRGGRGVRARPVVASRDGPARPSSSDDDPPRPDLADRRRR